MAEVVAFHRTASPDDGFYRVANQLGLALCRVHLSNRESRLVHAVMMKTYGFNKAMDWICRDQLAELTGIDITNISKVKMELVRRKILITKGRKIGINPDTDEWDWVGQSEKEKSQNRLVKESKLTPLKRVSSDSSKSQNRLSKKSVLTPEKVSFDSHNRQDTITKNTITKDSKNAPARVTQKPPAFRSFFDKYPAHRKGGTDTYAWKAWKSENLTELDAQKALAWLTEASASDKDWRTDGYGKYIPGITKFIRQRHWLTPLPRNTKTTDGLLYDDDISWAQNLGW
ncbi:replication protein [Grimontia kaedaensis]|uniref:Replication protein n=1 Tax=Grimontia kaedaensis TaxID=2872157 RepID=A0ABY4WNF1_9GAMM|nr:replication protein [Grimontia kaedaensis]USH01104.1 replication protein [Grimontia kaedaensis]